MVVIDLDAAGVRDVLAGTYPVRAAGAVVLRIGGGDVARARGGAVTELACVHPRHGARRALQPYAQRLAQATAVTTRGAACPACDGAGWVAYDSPAGRQIRTMALAFGVYRGLRLPGVTPLCSGLG
jgi:hypothetical protein